MDNIVYTLGFANSRREARQLVGHNHISINGKRVNIPSYLVKKGDIIQVDQKSREVTKVLGAIQSVARRNMPTWLEADYSQFKGTVKEVPNRDEVALAVEENMIVEYYSR